MAFGSTKRRLTHERTVAKERPHTCENCSTPTDTLYDYHGTLGLNPDDGTWYLVNDEFKGETKLQHTHICDYCMMWRGKRVGRYAEAVCRNIRDLYFELGSSEEG